MKNKFIYSSNMISNIKMNILMKRSINKYIMLTAFILVLYFFFFIGTHKDMSFTTWNIYVHLGFCTHVLINIASMTGVQPA